MLRSSAFAPRKKNSHKADFYLRAPSFLQWLRGRNCLLCDRGGCEGRIEAAHVDYAGGKGVGIKVADRFAVPMCAGHHRAQHAWGWQTFEDNFRIDALEASKAYWNAWPGRRAWEESRG